jgi:hypothetical protein
VGEGLSFRKRPRRTPSPRWGGWRPPDLNRGAPGGVKLSPHPSVARATPDRLTDNERFGVAAHYGNFEGASGLGLSLMGVHSETISSPQNDRVAISGGFGVDFDRGRATMSMAAGSACNGPADLGEESLPATRGMRTGLNRSQQRRPCSASRRARRWRPRPWRTVPSLS